MLLTLFFLFGDLCAADFKTFLFILFQDAHDAILERLRENELSRVAVVIQRVMMGHKDRCEKSCREYELRLDEDMGIISNGICMYYSGRLRSMLLFFFLFCHVNALFLLLL